jgi:ATP-dependent RNA helicase TDRD9
LHFREVRIERDSVNSVALNDELSGGANEVKCSSRMLVAGSVGLNSCGQLLTARDTTLMPSMPGLLALVALTFSPSAELRSVVLILLLLKLINEVANGTF